MTETQPVPVQDPRNKKQHYSDEDLLKYVAENQDEKTLQRYLDAFCDCV